MCFLYQKWDACLCNRDSDGDGLTNGQELGDPDCKWTEGQPPMMNIGLSHPGKHFHLPNKAISAYFLEFSQQIISSGVYFL